MQSKFDSSSIIRRFKERHHLLDKNGMLFKAIVVVFSYDEYLFSELCECTFHNNTGCDFEEISISFSDKSKDARLDKGIHSGFRTGYQYFYLEGESLKIENKYETIYIQFYSMK